MNNLDSHISLVFPYFWPLFVCSSIIHIFVSDPPYSVQKSFFFRQKAIIVQDGRKPEKNLETFNPRKRPDNTSSEEEKTAAKTASERSPKQQEDRVARVLRRLLDRLRGRIS